MSRRLSLASLADPRLILLWTLLVAASPAAAEIDVYQNPNAFEAVPPMRVGDPVPPLDIDEWLQGPALANFETGTVYAVEFFASWCGPCRKSLPELNALQEEFRDNGFVAIAVAASEADDGSALRTMVDLRSEQMSFLVGRTADQATFKRWMWAGRTSGLPWAFVVDRRGRVLWWGQPNDPEFRPAVERALSERLEVEAERARLEQRRTQRRELWYLQAKLWESYEAEAWEETAEIAQQLVASGDQAFYYEAAVLFELLFMRLERRAEALALGLEFVDGLLHTQPEGLHRIAELIVEAESMDTEAQKLATRALDRARSLTRDTNPEVLTTAARFYLRLGDSASARKIAENALGYALPKQEAALREFLETLAP